MKPSAEKQTDREIINRQYFKGEKRMKLYMLFIVMDLFTLLAYPFVFMHGKVDQFLIARNVLVTDPVTPGG